MNNTQISMDGEGVSPAFSSRMKLAELIETDYKLLPVLERLGIRLGFGEATVGETCTRYGIDPEFFMLLCQVHMFGDYTPSVSRLSRISIDDVVGYLHDSHEYYRCRQIPRLKEKLTEMVSVYPEAQKAVIRKFFDSYQNEIENHFSYEENKVFPYVSQLAKGKPADGYSIEQFEENHSNIDEKLDDLKNIVLKYLPVADNDETRQEVLHDIFHLQEDLDKHTLIENMILIPLVSRMEKNEK